MAFVTFVQPSSFDIKKFHSLVERSGLASLVARRGVVFCTNLSRQRRVCRPPPSKVHGQPVAWRIGLGRISDFT